MSTKRKLAPKLGQPMVKKSAKSFGKGYLDESKTVVSGGGNAIRSRTNGGKEVVSVSSDSSSDDEADVSEAESEEGASAAEEEDIAMGGAGTSAEENGEPSFGDLVRANASEHIDVAGAFEDPAQAVYPKSVQIQAPSGASLGTVLAQALKTNDVPLLESCLHTNDINTIKATIQRLDSPLAGTLLQKLAERLHRRPGRAGSLMVWVQWTLVTHGGYLATQRELIKKFAELTKVLDERAKGLQALLSLKGKLDMLEAQTQLRNSMQSQRRRDGADDDDEAVIYVEGQESGEDEEAPTVQSIGTNRGLDISGAESEASEDMSMPNSIVAESEDEEVSEDSENGLIDGEAEETDADSGDEDSVDHDDRDSQGDEEESDEGLHGAPPSKASRTGLFSQRR